MTRLLEPAGLGEQQLSTTLGGLMRGGVDYADLYFQVTRQESWSLEDGIVREGSFSLDQGVGVRANSGEKTGFAYSDELVLPALESAAGAARAIARQGQESARLTLIRVTYSIFLYARVFRHKTPFKPGRETSPTSTT